MGVLGIVDPAGANQLVSGTSLHYDVKRKFAWRMIFQNTTQGGGNIMSSGDINQLVIQCKKAARPKYEFPDTELKWGNEKWRVAGRLNINDLEVEFYDAIPNSVDGNTQGEITKSSAQIMYEWYTKIYDPITGNMGLSGAYKTKAVLELFDPAGAVIEQWLFTGLYPKTVNYNDVDMDSDDPVNVTCTFSYDKCFRLATGQAGGAGATVPDANPTEEFTAGG